MISLVYYATLEFCAMNVLNVATYTQLTNKVVLTDAFEEIMEKITSPINKESQSKPLEASNNVLKETMEDIINNTKGKPLSQVINLNWHVIMLV